jgi:hypothetical protein
MPEETEKPKVKLLGQNGNAFVIIGLCSKAARQAGWTIEQIESVQNEMTNGNYDHLLATALKYFDVE